MLSLLRAAAPKRTQQCWSRVAFASYSTPPASGSGGADSPEYSRLMGALEGTGDQELMASSSKGASPDSSQYENMGRWTFYEQTAIQPHHLGMEFRTKPKARRPKPLAVADSTKAKARDPFRLLKIDPLWEVKNTALLGHYVTEMGKIRPRKETELTVRSQRRLARAIKRAKMMGIIPLLGNPAMKNSTLIRPPQPMQPKDKSKIQ